MQKKGQEGVIITVLLILIAIAAVAAVSYFIINQVRQGQAEAANKINCQKLSYEITGASDGSTSVIVKRNAGGEDVKLKSIIVIANNNKTTTEDPGVLLSATINVTALISGEKVEVAPLLENGFTCDVATSVTVA